MQRNARTMMTAAQYQKPKSQILGDASNEMDVYFAPKPLHPRAIEGTEIRVKPPIPLTPERYMVLMAISGRMYRRQRAS